VVEKAEAEPAKAKAKPKAEKAAEGTKAAD